MGPMRSQKDTLTKQEPQPEFGRLNLFHMPPRIHDGFLQRVVEAGLTVLDPLPDQPGC